MGSSFKLKNGSILLSTEAPGGIYNASQLKKIAALCDGDAVVVKATEDQRLALLVNPAMASSVADELKSIGLGIRHYQDGLHQPVSCIGEMCEEHEQDALGGALDLSAEIEGLKLSSPLKIGINGCAKCCVPCHTLDISIVGDSSGYRISLGGKSSQLPEIASFIAEGVPSAEMPKLIRSVIDIYKNGAQEGETLQEYIEREGSSKFIEALAPWSQDAAISEDPFASTSPTPVATTDDDLDHTSSQLDDLPPEVLPSHDSVLPDLGSDSDIAGELQEIPVAAMGSHDGVSIPIEAPLVEDLPDISMHEISVEADLSQAAKDLESQEPGRSIPTELDDADFSEVKIDAGDALRGNAQTSGGDMDVSGNEAASPPVTTEDSAEDSMEAALTAGIDAQRDLVSDDASEAVRSEGVEILETANVSILEESNAQEDLSAGEQQVVGEAETSNAVGPSQDDEFDIHDHLPLSEVVAAKRITPQILPSKHQQSKASWSVAGFDLDEHGAPVVLWSNGASMTITAEAVELGTIRVGSREIRVVKKEGGLQVEVDGVKMFLPEAA